MHRRWLIVALCFCAFSGCVSCQSNYDYCGPMPDNGGDFMYRKNSILGGDPTMPLADEANADEAGEEEQSGEDGAEPTPAPEPDPTSSPDLDLDLDEGPDMAPSDAEPQASDDEADESDAELTDAELPVTDNDEPAKKPVSTLQWHSPLAKPATSPVKQLRFR